MPTWLSRSPVHVLMLLLGSVAASSVAQQPASLVENGTFDADISGWSAWYAPGQSEGRAQWVQRDEGGALQATVLRRDRESSVQIYRGPFRLEQDKWYAISFEAKADKPETMRISVMKNNPPYGSMGLGADAGLTTGWQRYDMLMRASGTWDDCRIDFFPPTTFWLDNVTIREIGTEASLWPIQSVGLGRGWRGDVANLTDGNPRTFINSNYYPLLPLLLTVDLGQSRPVGAVAINAEDRGRQTYVENMVVEVSADGQTWRRWADCSKSAEGNINQARPARFMATNVAVPARYVRVRVTRLRSMAWLSGVEIIAAADAAENSLERLPVVPPGESLVFEGWDYATLGYSLSPGESARLQFTNQGDQQIATELKWRLETYAGDQLCASQSPLSVDGLSTVSAGVALPGNLPDGPYRLRFSVGDGAPEDALYFDNRVAQPNALLSLRLAALLDCQDAEGWVRLICGPVTRFVDVRRSLPADPRDIDAALVMAEDWPADSERVNQLRSFVQSGGKALFFGKVAPSLADMLPVQVNHEDPWLSTPQRLEGLPFWDNFDPHNGPRHYGVRVTAKPGAKILASWDDGTPALAQGAFGEGTVLYLGAGAGRIWEHRPEVSQIDELTLRSLYYMLGREDAGEALSALLKSDHAADLEEQRAAIARVGSPAADSAQLGISRDNIGRFGWAVGDNGLVVNVSDDGEMRTPASTSPWRVSVPGTGALKGIPTSQNWLSKTVSWRDGGEELLSCTISLGSDMVLWESGGRRINIESDATQLICQTRAGPRVLSVGDEIVGTDLTASWLVLINSREDVRDSPKLVVLSARPTDLHFTGAVELTFAPPGCGALWTGHVWGVRRLAPGQTATWLGAPPDTLAEAAARTARRCLEYPIGADEVFSVSGNAVTVTNRFEYRRFTDAWGTEPSRMAPIPPILALLRSHGPRPILVEQDTAESDVATKHGPLQLVSGDTVTYRLEIPGGEHFGVVPVAGASELTDIIDYYGLQGIESVTRASGGLTTSDAFLADLREYMSSGSYENPFAAPCIDLYKWWYCFPTVTGRPALGADARPRVDEHYRKQYWETLNYYPHKSLIRYRREPWTGLDYTVSFIWPVMWRDGVRYFVDQNESAAVIMYCWWAYSQYYGEWTTTESNWNLIRWLHNYLTRVHDWAFMCSSNQEFFSTVGIDMVNSEYPGNLALARMASQVGDVETQRLATYLAAKAMIPAVARLYVPDYIDSITADGDPWREDLYHWSMQEAGFSGQKSMVQRGDTSFILSLGGGFLDTSKGTGPEICALYKYYARDKMMAYEQAVKDTEREYDAIAGWSHLMNRAFLGWPKVELIKTARAGRERHTNWGWQATKAPHNLAVVDVMDSPVFLAEWAPAEYVSGQYDPERGVVRLELLNQEPGRHEVRLYSRLPVREVRINDTEFEQWEYDAATGKLSLDLLGPGPENVEVRLGSEMLAPAHPYLAK